MPGWTWEYVEENVTLPRLDALSRDWKRFPPLHMVVAAYFGFGKDSGDKSVRIDQGDGAGDAFIHAIAGMQGSTLPS